MSRARRTPLTVVLVAALLALLGAGSTTAPGAVPQWDNLALALVGGWAAWRCHRLTRAMGSRDRLPWQVLGASALVFALASLEIGRAHV